MAERATITDQERNSGIPIDGPSVITVEGNGYTEEPILIIPRYFEDAQGLPSGRLVCFFPQRGTLPPLRQEEYTSFAPMTDPNQPFDQEVVDMKIVYDTQTNKYYFVNSSRKIAHLDKIPSEKVGNDWQIVNDFEWHAFSTLRARFAAGDNTDILFSDDRKGHIFVSTYSADRTNGTSTLQSQRMILPGKLYFAGSRTDNSSQANYILMQEPNAKDCQCAFVVDEGVVYAISFVERNSPLGIRRVAVRTDETRWD